MYTIKYKVYTYLLHNYIQYIYSTYFLSKQIGKGRQLEVMVHVRETFAQNLNLAL